ncbi:MAG: hypothetical protein PHI57_10235, partial [Bacteroidales bacterium]|nr:hypothetical protein [Bacteroidales bacterium]
AANGNSRTSAYLPATPRGSRMSSPFTVTRLCKKPAVFFMCQKTSFFECVKIFDFECVETFRFEGVARIRSQM